MAQSVQPAQADVGAYVFARVAHSMGEADKAVQGFQTALASAPGNSVIAEGAFDQALASGNQRLAVEAARILDQAGDAGTEVRLALIVEAVRNRDWTTADKQIASLNREDVFGFLAPILGAWASVGSHNNDPFALLDKLAPNTIGGIYAQEHRPLLLLSQGHDKEGMDALRERIGERDTRADRLRVVAATHLARQGKRAEALAMLEGESGMVADARAQLTRRGKLRGEILTPEQGMAELFLRLSLDLERQNETGLALSFARLATFLVPDRSESWLVASGLLTQLDRDRDALVALANIVPGDPAEGTANDLKVRLLADIGDETVALEQARKATAARNATPGDWQRLGDLYIQLGRNQDAAAAYDQALQVKKEGVPSEPEWRLWLSKGGALDQAGQWQEAKAALETAYKLAPREPMVLNYLGYAQLVRRENLVEAEQMIRQARRFNPESAQITDSLGWARFLRGDSADAIRLLERAVGSEPNDPTNNDHLGDAYYSVGRRYEARYAWRAALVTAEEKDASRLRTKIEKGYSTELASP
jgi:Flp pilus assembly protein TadD